uniref:DUF674 family protein n=1 Tax=Davidia involucrata TaxID=16924 RepID=A0A5B7AKQ9_DAVIN
MAANGALQSVSLKVVVLEERNQVAFVEAGKEFVDVLVSFMTMPIGMIVRLSRDHLKDEMGCLKNLYNSIEKLDKAKLVRSAECKDMLLCPRSAAEFHYRKLKLDLIDRSANEYYVCQSCDLVSFYQTAHCRCENSFKYRVELKGNKSSVPRDEGVFVNPNMPFMIDDEFLVKHSSTKNLVELKIKDDTWRTENIGKDKVLKLMVRSLVSQTPFSDIFMNNLPDSNTSSTICPGKYKPRRAGQSQNVTDSATRISLNLVIDNPRERVLYAEAGEDFVDLLCSFLTIPLCYFFKEFPHLPFKGSMGKLYKNIQDLDDNSFKSKEMKETLVNPKLAPGLAQHNQLIGLEEASNLSFKTLCSNFEIKRTELGSSSNQEEVETGRGFVKPTKFMVENNLSVTHFSLESARKLMNEMEDIKEDKVIVDRDKALHLLAASLVSESALTDVFILKKPKQEQKQVNREDVDDDECCCCCF